MANVKEMDLAEGQAASDEAPTYRRGNSGAPAAEAASKLSSEGLTAVDHKTEPEFVDPEVVQILYHKFDGRVVTVPKYMAPKLLAGRIFADTSVPTKYVGQLAWAMTPNDNYVPGNIMCFLHADQLPEVIAELESIGLVPGRCSKGQIHTEYDARIHAELKHKKEWAALKDSRDRTDKADARSASTTQSEAMLKIAEALLAQNKKDSK